MSTVEEKYAKFLITEDLKEKFEDFYSCSPYKPSEINKVVVQTTDTKMETLYNLLREKHDGELV